MIRTLDEAIARLDQRSKHWRLQAENDKDEGRGFSVTCWAMGRRFTVYRRTPLLAALEAVNRIDGIGAKGLKLAGGGVA